MLPPDVGLGLTFVLGASFWLTSVDQHFMLWDDRCDVVGVCCGHLGVHPQPEA